MGLLDNLGSNTNLTNRLVAVAGALLAGKLLSDRIDQPEDGKAPPHADPQAAPTQAPSSGEHEGGIFGGGLGGLLDKLRNAGHGEVADSWVQPGANKPIAPKDLGGAIGQKTLGQLAAQAGMSEQELLEQLSKVLPGMVDKLTPDGRVPSNAEVANSMWKNPW